MHYHGLLGLSLVLGCLTGCNSAPKHQGPPIISQPWAKHTCVTFAQAQSFTYISPPVLNVSIPVTVKLLPSSINKLSSNAQGLSSISP